MLVFYGKRVKVQNDNSLKCNMLAIFLLLILFLAIGSPLIAAEKISDRHDVMLTAYAGGFGLVGEQRDISVSKGMNSIVLHAVSNLLEPDSLLIRGDSGLQIVEQYIQLPTLTSDNLARHFIGRKVTVVREESDVAREAVILAVKPDLVLKIDGKIETGFKGRILYPSTDGLVGEMGIYARVDSYRQRTATVSVSYLTRGISWRMVYRSVVMADTMLLQGWALVSNKTDVNFHQADIALVAGKVNKTAVPVRRMMMANAAMEKTTMAEINDNGEYHRYLLPGQVDLAANEQKQMVFFAERKVKYKQQYRVQGDFYSGTDSARKVPVSIYYSFTNQKKEGLGMPLAAGVMKFFQQGERGRMVFLGEDRIVDIPEGGDFEVSSGNAFDISATKTIMERTIEGKRRQSAKVRYVLVNSKKKAVTVRVDETFPGDWTITDESISHSRKDGRSASWLINLPPQAKETLFYRVSLQQ